MASLILAGSELRRTTIGIRSQNFLRDIGCEQAEKDWRYRSPSRGYIYPARHTIRARSGMEVREMLESNTGDVNPARGGHCVSTWLLLHHSAGKPRYDKSNWILDAKKRTSLWRTLTLYESRHKIVTMYNDGNSAIGSDGLTSLLQKKLLRYRKNFIKAESCMKQNTIRCLLFCTLVYEILSSSLCRQQCEIHWTDFFLLQKKLLRYRKLYQSRIVHETMLFGVLYSCMKSYHCYTDNIAKFNLELSAWREKDRRLF